MKSRENGRYDGFDSCISKTDTIGFLLFSWLLWGHEELNSLTRDQTHVSFSGGTVLTTREFLYFLFWNVKLQKSWKGNGGSLMLPWCQRTEWSVTVQLTSPWGGLYWLFCVHGETISPGWDSGSVCNLLNSARMMVYFYFFHQDDFWKYLCEWKAAVDGSLQDDSDARSGFGCNQCNPSWWTHCFSFQHSGLKFSVWKGLQGTERHLDQHKLSLIPPLLIPPLPIPSLLIPPLLISPSSSLPSSSLPSSPPLLIPPLPFPLFPSPLLLVLYWLLCDHYRVLSTVHTYSMKACQKIGDCFGEQTKK